LGAEGIGSSTAEHTDQKIQWIRNGAGERFDQIEIEIAAYFTVVTPDGAGTRAKMAPMFGMTPEVFAEHPNVLVGSVDEICDRIVERRERFGISYISFGASVMDSVIPVVERLSGK
jgi:ABC-type lipopolysaccharide export system ATPase subunit